MGSSYEEDCSRSLAQKDRVSSALWAVLARKTAHDRWLKDVEFRVFCEAVLVKKTAHDRGLKKFEFRVFGGQFLRERLLTIAGPKDVEFRVLFVRQFL